MIGEVYGIKLGSNIAATENKDLIKFNNELYLNHQKMGITREFDGEEFYSTLIFTHKDNGVLEQNFNRALVATIHGTIYKIALFSDKFIFGHNQESLNEVVCFINENMTSEPEFGEPSEGLKILIWDDTDGNVVLQYRPGGTQVFLTWEGITRMNIKKLSLFGTMKNFFK